MNIQELQSFNLADAAKFHFRLNPKIWGSDEHLLPEVKAKLLDIAEDFRQFLGVPELDIKDITISGSNAAYSYTDKSDIDLHLVVKFPENKNSEIYRELFDSKKFQYNNQYDYKIGDADIELYVQNVDQPHHSQGIYSLLGDKWLQVPRRIKAEVDDISVKHKYEDWGHKIEQALKSNDEQTLEQMLKRLKEMRAAGLESSGEFGVENLTFKLLRNNGYIQQLFDLYHKVKSERLSLEELKKPKKKFKYGYGEDVSSTPDGVDGSTCQFLSEKDVEEDASSNPNGVSSGTNMFLDDQDNATPEQHLKDFVRYCQQRLGLNEKAVIKLRRDPEWAKRNKTFGRFNPNIGALEVAWGNRHIMDVFRTVAHELTHQRQNEVSMQPEDAGDTGSEWENQANALAGVLMREWAGKHPEMFDAGMIQAQDELDEGKLSKAAAALAMTTALGMGNTAQAQSVGDTLRAIQNIGTATKTISGMTRAGINAEMAQELMNYIRAQGGDPHGQNKSTLYQWQKRMEQDRQARAQDSQPVNDKYLDDYRATNNKPARYYQQPNPAVNESKINLYTVDDFAVNEFSNFFEYRRWHSKAKESNRGATRYWPDKYSNLFVNTALVESSNNFHQNLKLSKKFSEALKTTDLRDLVSIKVGGKIAVISTLAVPSEQGGRIELSGFVKPKTIVKINLDNQDKIDEIEFDNGDKFPEAAEFTTVGGTNITTTAFYPDQKSASRAYTIVWMESSKLEGRGWTVENYMSDSVEIQEGASGYIPTKKQAKDPRYSMALTVDIKPGQVGKEANKLKLKTDSQGHPQIARADGLFEKLSLELAQFKKTKVAESVEQQLDEVAMSPGALTKWASSDAAQGIRAGFEAELIFRDTTNDDDDDTEMEPDYDYDERVRSIADVIDFFQGGDYGDMGRREAESLRESLDEKYYEWYDERMYDAFRDEAEDLVRKVIEEEDWDLDNEIQKQLELLDLPTDEFSAIIQAGERAPIFTRSSDQQAYIKENPLYQKYLDAQTEAEDLLDTLVEDSVRLQDKYYDTALDDFRENFQIDDDSDFFESIGLTYMSDIASEYSLSWPYLTGSGGGNNGGSREWDDIGNSLNSAIDMPVKVSSGYHSATRKEGQWIVEPDSSLSPDDGEDMGLEIVSPPMPLLTALEKLQEVTDWANNPSEGNAYTNSSTGLHMGVSVPYKGGDVDYVKLILFLGDEYVLQSFGREANTYTKSAMSKFRENIRGGRADPAGAMALMRSNLIEFAYREIQKGVGEGKYTSAHIQDGYIEFRSAGGDWLAEGDAEPGKLENTMLRYARAMQLAANPAEERQEYAKKLYKLIAPEGDGQLALFSRYAAGTINKDELKKQWAEKTIGTERKMNQRWKLYNRATGEPVAGQEYNGYTEEEARAKAKGKISPGSSDRDFDSAYELRNIGGDQQWEIYSVDTGETLEIVTGRNKGEAADAVFDKYAAQKIGFNVRPYQDPATMTQRAKLAQRIAKPKSTTSAQAVDGTGEPMWEIYDTASGNTVETVLAADSAAAQEEARQWLASIDASQPELFAIRPKMETA